MQHLEVSGAVRHIYIYIYIYIYVIRRLKVNNEPDALFIQIYFVIKLYMLPATSLPIIRSLLLHIRHW